jgi:hypothetical protein
MIINVSARISPEMLIEAGEKAGLSENAINYLRHFEEVPLELHVDAENGAVCGCKILINFD